jgi:peptidoglycan/LPS O-acetylase OafA/YrhL
MADNGMVKEKLFFPNLDGLRFISFLGVFLSHSFYSKNDGIENQEWYKVVKGNIFRDGDLGVSFFFVLSGFLITYLLLKENQINSRIDVRRFYLRRVLRIWPLYFFSVFFGFVIFPYFKSLFGQVPLETADPLLCATFLNNFNSIVNGPPDSSVLSVLWSVAIEEQFYLVWPLIFFLLPQRNYYLVFPLVIIASLFYRSFYSDIETHTLGVISDMAMGGWAAYLSFTNQKFISRISASPIFLSMVPYLVVFLIMLFNYDLFCTQALIIWKRIIIGLFFSWIILDQNFNSKCLIPLSRFKLVSSLGKYTYGLYCLHTIALLIVTTLLSKLSWDVYAWQLWVLQLPSALLLSIGLSVLSYRYFESPFLRLKNKYSYIIK